MAAFSAIPATIQVTHAAPTSDAVGIENFLFRPGPATTVDLSKMGPGRRYDFYAALHTARLNGLVTTNPLTAAIDEPPATRSHVY